MHIDTATSTTYRLTSSIRRKVVLLLCLSVITGAISYTVRAEESSFISIDAPGAGTNSGQGTFAFSIDDRGTIAGYFLDGNNTYHGFIRDRHGRITTVDVPGAGSGRNFADDAEAPQVGLSPSPL